MTNRERILAKIRERPGLTDRQLREITGIEPHQQVNGICRRLAEQGLIRREQGPDGITNHPASASGSTPAPPRPVERSERGTRGVREHDDCWLVGPVDWDRTLLVLPCSGAKRVGAGNAGTQESLLHELPSPLRAELADARRRNLAAANADTDALLAALDRYDGSLYRQLGSVRDALSSRHVVIISGGYGLVLGGEPIGWYDARFHARDWPRDLIARCLCAYVTRHRLTNVVAFAAATTHYAKPLKWTAWPTGVRAWLLSPLVHGGGAQRRTPTSIGQAIVTLVECQSIDHTWTAADGTRLAATRLQ